jgi:hypothetical protein
MSLLKPATPVGECLIAVSDFGFQFQFLVNELISTKPLRNLFPRPSLSQGLSEALTIPPSLVLTAEDWPNKQARQLWTHPEWAYRYF